jgi:amino acid adenylation domain-containing protein
MSLTPPTIPRQLPKQTRWNATQPSARTLYQVFDNQVRATPNAVAINCAGETLTYAELATKVTRLGNVLQTGYAVHKGRVGICLNRSAELVIAVLAVLRTGSAYVPLDPHAPADRNKFIIEDCKLDLLITETSLLHGLGAAGNITLDVADVALCADEDSTEVVGSPSDLAYVIYTSGSTGQPKGVLVENHAIVSLLECLGATFDFVATEHFLLKTPVVFDVSTVELFSWFFCGGQLSVLESEAEKDPEQIYRAIVESKVTIVNFVPSLFSRFIEYLEFGKCTHFAQLRSIFLAGEALTVSLAARYYRLSDNLPSLENLYGPTETTVFATRYPVDAKHPQSDVPIGKPLPGYTARVVRDDGELCSVDEPGELWIGGTGLARGYTRGDLNGAKFVSHPQAPGQTFYRTGDRAKWQQDGNLAFLGRRDNQIKLRGYRIELEEIEHQLHSMPGISQCAVLKLVDKANDEFLGAYYSATENLSDDGIKNYLRQRLPDYMVPAFFVRVLRLPLTATGKIDRNSLQSLPLENAGTAIARNENDDAFQTILIDNLGISSIDWQRSFCSLGGTSLKAISLNMAVQRSFGVKLRMQDIFDAANLVELRHLIEKSLPVPPERSPIRSTLTTASLLPAQRSIFFFCHLNPQSPQYHITEYFELAGLPSEARLEAAFNRLIEQYEILRTAFRVDRDEPIQWIRKSVRFKLDKFYDLEPLQALEKVVRPFDLQEAPLLRAALIVTKERCWLAIDVHHIVADGHSMSVLVRALFALYEDQQPAREAFSYYDYCSWYFSPYNQDNIARQEEYWLGQFSTVPEALNIHTDYPRSSRSRFEGKTVFLTLDAGVCSGLSALAIEKGVTAFALFLGCFSILLQKLTRQHDLVIGVPVSTRGEPRFQETTGLFINTLALRCHPHADKSFDGYLGEIWQLVNDALEHRDYPFETLVRQTNPERSTDHNPLFSVLLNFDDGSASAPLAVDVIDRKTYYGNTTKFDLVLDVILDGTSIDLALTFNSELFGVDTATRYLEYLSAICRQAVSSPERSIADIDIMTVAEKKRVLRDFNDTAVDYGHTRPIHELIERQAALDPDRIALFCDLQATTYGDLDGKANSLAAILMAKGARQGDFIPVLMTRGPELCITLLAILKAGAAFVPLDVQLPPARLDRILAELGNPLVLLNEATAEKHRLSNAAALVVRKEELARAGKPSTPQISMDGPIYVIYTSGTTGQPKGVVNRHQGITNRFLYMNKRYGCMPTDVVLLTSNHAFDAAVWQIFWPLINGIQVVIPVQRDKFDLHELVGLIERHRVTITDFVPAVFNLMVDLLSANHALHRQIRSLRHLLVGGEAISPHHVYRLKEMLPQVGITNTYGPSEASIGTVFYEVPDARTDLLPIGKPIDNVKAVILDTNRRPVPIGVPGELYLGGICLGSGYVANTALTDAVFPKLQFLDLKPERYYQTGDLARFLPDGNIEYLGRLDQQVKIRGVRVELKEIELRLLAFQHIREVALTYDARASTSNQLCAYYVSDCALDAAALERHLRDELPSYMVPQHYVWLAAMPLNSNGKIDHKALPKPQPEADKSNSVGFDAHQEEVAKVFAEVLGVDQTTLSPRSNVFEVGGDSLKSIMLTHKLTKELAVPVSLQTLFSLQTIEALAGYVRTIRIDKMSSLPPQRAQGPSADLAGNVRCESVPLAPLIKSGRLKPVDAVALDYIRDEIADRIDLPRERLIDGFFQGAPLVDEIIDCEFGRVAIVVMPIFASELFLERERLHALLENAFALAVELGAGTVSLTGLLASATKNGTAVEHFVPDPLILTTGHETTAAAVAINLKSLIERCAMDLRQETVGVLGIGSIGTSVLELLLANLPHPRRLILCDIYQKRDHLEFIKKQLQTGFGYAGEITTLQTEGRVPAEFYRAHIIIGATNVPNVLDIDQLEANTIVIDDSGPHCYDNKQAISRFENQQDILFTEGGELRLPCPVGRTVFSDHNLAGVPTAVHGQIASCVIAGLILQHMPGVGRTIGTVRVDDSSYRLSTLKQLGFQAPVLHSNDYILPAEIVESALNKIRKQTQPFQSGEYVSNR